MKEVDDLLSIVQQFMEVHETDSAVVIVSPETFAKIQPALRDIKHDKLYSEGKLGRHTVKSDLLAFNDTVMTVCKPIEFDDILKLKAEDYLPAFTCLEIEKMQKHVNNAKRKRSHK